MDNIDISKVYLLSVPLENDYKNTLYFTDKTSQNNYFMSKKIREATNFTYLRKEQEISVPYHYDLIYDCNYLMYQNPRLNNKWFYCFIKNMRYENEECTILEIETDVMQTWAFDYEVKHSFVEREHVQDDTIGLHTIPEGLETGEFICSSIKEIESERYCYVLATTRDIDHNYTKVGGKIYNGIYSGVKYYGLWTTADLETLIETFDEKGYGEDITAIFVIPTSLIGGKTYDSENPVYRIPESVGSSNCGSLKISRPTNLDGYIPNNKKLLTAPYQYLLVDNCCGGSTEFFYEHFKNGNECEFNIEGSITPGTSRILIPKAYCYGNSKGVDDNFINHSLSLGKFPICNWTSDTYTNWLTQNSVNNAVGFASAGLQVVGGVAAVATGAGAVAGASMVANGGIQIASQMGSIYQHSFGPMQSKGNVNCGDVLTSMYENSPKFYQMSIKKEYARIIDQYFSMFGYKVNEVKKPNTDHRERYWYIKTIDVNIDGSIPQDDMQKIKNVYNNGVTFWRSASEINNYGLSNNII